MVIYGINMENIKVDQKGFDGLVEECKKVIEDKGGPYSTKKMIKDYEYFKSGNSQYASFDDWYKSLNYAESWQERDLVMMANTIYGTNMIVSPQDVDISSEDPDIIVPAFDEKGNTIIGYPYVETSQMPKKSPGKNFMGL